MKPKFQILLLCLAILAAIAATAPSAFAAAPPPSTSTAPAYARDTLRNVNIWVFFKDKDNRQSARPVSARAALRRRKAGFRDSESDRPVSNNYIREVERRGAALRTVFSWGNAASFSISPSRVSEISALPFVKSVSPVGVYISRKIDAPPPVGGLPKSKTAASKSATSAAAGGYDWHTEAVGVSLAHDYIRYKGLGTPGHGVIMAFFDGGFRLDHAAYKRLRDSSQVLAAYDFVDNDTLLADPDSVANNPRSVYYQNDKHGSQTLSLAAAYVPGVYVGTAFGASFLLARTEDNAVESRTEEDLWAEAVEWAENNGAAIISSSLGYRGDHTDSTENYNYKNMDGATAVISIAAAEAVKRGVIVVNSVGNEGNRIAGTLIAPSDADGVVAVGAVTQNRTLSDFSSIGPTYDGRMKPEVVAPGSYVPVPDPYSDDRASYTLVNGTSFSAPIVSAIIALILQANTDISPQAARERLYASCGFVPGQSVANNRFGYGIPNAALAVMGANEIFLRITDSTQRALAGAVVEFKGQTSDTVYVADSVGNILIGKVQKSNLPAQLRISYRDSRQTDTITVAALPFASIVEMEGKWDDGLKVTPNITRKNGVIRGRYTFAGANASTQVVATVRTLTGKSVWNQRLRLSPDGSVDFKWDTKNGGKGGAAAGVYIVMIRHGYSVICERVVVSN